MSSEWTPLLSKLLLRGTGVQQDSVLVPLTMKDQVGLEDAITHTEFALFCSQPIYLQMSITHFTAILQELGDLYEKEGPVSTSNLTNLYVL